MRTLPAIPGRRTGVSPRLGLPAIERAHLPRALALGYLGFLAVYLGCGYFHLRTPQRLAPGPLDLWFAYLPWTVWVYLSQVPLLILALALAPDAVGRSRAFYAMLLATLLAGAVFLIWPTELPRPAPPQDGITGAAWRALFLADVPRNCFPSLHVALALIAAATLRQRAGWRIVAPLWALVIVLSTLTTRQHIALDVAGGVLLAPPAWLIAGKLFVHERARPTAHPAGR